MLLKELYNSYNRFNDKRIWSIVHFFVKKCGKNRGEIRENPGKSLKMLIFTSTFEREGSLST